MKGVPGVMTLESNTAVLSFLGTLMPCGGQWWGAMRCAARCGRRRSLCNVDAVAAGEHRWCWALQPPAWCYSPRKLIDTPSAPPHHT